MCTTLKACAHSCKPRLGYDEAAPIASYTDGHLQLYLVSSLPSSPRGPLPQEGSDPFQLPLHSTGQRCVSNPAMVPWASKAPGRDTFCSGTIVLRASRGCKAADRTTGALTGSAAGQTSVRPKMPSYTLILRGTALPPSPTVRSGSNEHNQGHFHASQVATGTLRPADSSSERRAPSLASISVKYLPCPAWRWSHHRTADNSAAAATTDAQAGRLAAANPTSVIAAPRYTNRTILLLPRPAARE